MYDKKKVLVIKTAVYKPQFFFYKNVYIFGCKFFLDIPNRIFVKKLLYNILCTIKKMISDERRIYCLMQDRIVLLDILE